jgi:hydroxypyruvate isomerase
MNRRTFAKTALAAVASSGALFSKTHATGASQTPAKGAAPFKLKYAPSFNHFKHSAGEEPVEVLHFMKDHGFEAIEDNPMMGRPVEEQVRIGKELEKLGMTMGVFVTGFDFGTPMFTGNRMDAGKRDRDPKAVREHLRQKCEAAVETAKRVNAKWTTVVPGAEDPSLEYGYQFQNVVENLQYCASIFEPHGIIMVLEPLNHMNHPGLFLKHIPQAYTLCKSVGSPSCKILNDLYHQQISEGNLIPNIDRAWDEIAYFQVGDNPGRKEPTTGEINYLNVFKHIHAKGFTGIVGMEHGISRPGKEGEMRLIKAYREVDAF